MFSGGFIGQFRELADQFFKDSAHLSIADGFRMQVDASELFRDQVQQSGFAQAFHLSVEVKAFKDIPDRW